MLLCMREKDIYCISIKWEVSRRALSHEVRLITRGRRVEFINRRTYRTAGKFSAGRQRARCGLRIMNASGIEHVSALGLLYLHY